MKYDRILNNTHLLFHDTAADKKLNDKSGDGSDDIDNNDGDEDGANGFYSVG